MGQFIKVAQVGDLSAGEGMVVEVEAEGKEIALFNVDGEFYAIDNVCLHMGGPLGEGMLEGDVVVCPWHNWRYNVKSGQSPVNPAVAVQSYAVKVEGDDVLVEV